MQQHAVNARWKRLLQLNFREVGPNINYWYWAQNFFFCKKSFPSLIRKIVTDLLEIFKIRFFTFQFFTYCTFDCKVCKTPFFKARCHSLFQYALSSRNCNLKKLLWYQLAKLMSLETHVTTGFCYWCHEFLKFQDTCFHLNFTGF